MTVRHLKSFFPVRSRNPSLVHVVPLWPPLEHKIKDRLWRLLELCPPSQTNTVSYTSIFLPCRCLKLSLPPSLILHFPTCSLFFFFPKCRALRAALWPGARCYSPEKLEVGFKTPETLGQLPFEVKKKKEKKEKKKDWDPLEVNVLPAKEGILLTPKKKCTVASYQIKKPLACRCVL